MARSHRIPAYQNHRASGQARVRIDGKDIYLGKYDSPESHARYAEIIAEYTAKAKTPKAARTLTSVLCLWWQECKRRYTKGKGRLGGAGDWRPLIKLLRENYGDEPIRDIGPVKCRRLLEAEAEKQNWSLSYTRKNLGRIKLIFKWAVSEELIDVAAYHRVKECQIRNGRRSEPIPPVTDETIDATLPHLQPMVADMVKFQRLVGCRPGELIAMRRDEIDRSADVWIYIPQSHKNEHRGKSRVIYIGPRAQKIIAPWLLKANEDGFVWVHCKGGPYKTNEYRQVVHRAIERINREHKKAGREPLPHWSPNQLRKAAAASIRAALDVEYAASVLGHSSSVVTGDHYAHATRQRAIEAAKQLG